MTLVCILTYILWTVPPAYFANIYYYHKSIKSRVKIKDFTAVVSCSRHFIHTSMHNVVTALAYLATTINYEGKSIVKKICKYFTIVNYDRNKISCHDHDEPTSIDHKSENIVK